MTPLFRAYLITSLLGAVLTLVILVAKPMTKRIFSASWHYYIWLAVLIVMMVPVQFHMPFLGEENVLTATYDWAESKVSGLELPGADEKDVSVTEGRVDEKGRYIVSSALQEQRMQETALIKLPGKLARIWWLVAVGAFAVRVFHYGGFLLKVWLTTGTAECPEVGEYTKRKVFVRRADWTSSPLLLGMVFPVLILPRWQLTGEELRNVLAHEMTHLRRNDMLLKWFVVIVKSLHWFNPLVYVVSGQMNLECEISCDMSVTKSMDKVQQKSYVETILKLVSGHRTREYALTMGMSGNKNQLKVRFMSMKRPPRVGVVKRALSWSMAVCLMTAAFICSGELAMKVSAGKEPSASYYVDECSKCGETVFYRQRDMVASVQGCSKFPYLVYTYRCEDCRKTWYTREAVEDGMALKYPNGNKNPMLVDVKSFPTVIDAEAERALERAGIDLYHDAESVQEALEMIEKAIKKAK